MSLTVREVPYSEAGIKKHDKLILKEDCCLGKKGHPGVILDVFEFHGDKADLVGLEGIQIDIELKSGARIRSNTFNIYDFNFYFELSPDNQDMPSDDIWPTWGEKYVCKSASWTDIPVGTVVIILNRAGDFVQYQYLNRSKNEGMDLVEFNRLFEKLA